MLRKLRITLACIFFIGITSLFLDFTGSIHSYLGWMAKVQFLPALLSLNFIIVAILLLLTFLFGRLYCSVICPLGVLQDIIAWIGRKAKRNRYTYSPAKQWLRIGVLVVFIIALIAGVGVIPAILAPYSSYGRIVASVFAPLYYAINNLLALGAERLDSYAFYSTDIWLQGIGTLVISLVTLFTLAILAWRNGRTYCNAICPVGTVLGFISRFSLFVPQIDTNKCNGCTRCARNCKAACIDAKNHSIDYSRCVMCMDCIDNCSQNAISYRRRSYQTSTTPSTNNKVDKSRRGFLAITALLAATPLANAKKKGDGGLAVIEKKKIPQRNTRIVPPGAMSIRNMEQHCTACQLCVSACPNDVLRPSENIMTLMQPEASYERGYCRPECVKCSTVCPTGAIKPISVEDKSSTQIGHAVWIEENCLAARGVRCDNCFRHCPTGAIQMIEVAGTGKRRSRKIPTIDTERCIGCGACENLCPARPLSGIYVEGHRNHRTI